VRKYGFCLKKGSGFWVNCWLGEWDWEILGGWRWVWDF
jgi:hypothetical protein